MATISQVNTEIKGNEALLQTFYTTLLNYLYSGTGIPPEFQDVVDGLVLEQELTSFNSTLGNLQILPIGLVGEFIHRYSSLQREAIMIYREKSSYYTDEELFLGDLGTFEANQTSRRINTIQGKYTDQIGLLS